MAWNNTWDETQPEAGDPADQIHVFIQNVKKAVRERINEAHFAPSGDDTDTWMHRPGSARIAVGAKSSLPSAMSDNEGKVYYATDTNQLLISDGSNWIEALFQGGTSGTVDVTNGSTSVTGSSTSFTNFSAGDFFWVQGEDRVYKIDSIGSATSLTLVNPYQGSTASGVDYKIGRATLNHYVAKGKGSAYNLTITDGKLGSVLNANSKKIQNLADPTENGDAVRYPVEVDDLEEGAGYLLTLLDSPSVLGDFGVDSRNNTFDVSDYVPNAADYGYFCVLGSEGGSNNSGANLRVSVDPTDLSKNNNPTKRTVAYWDKDDDQPSEISNFVAKLDSDQKLHLHASAPQGGSWKLIIRGYYK